MDVTVVSPECKTAVEKAALVAGSTAAAAETAKANKYDAHCDRAGYDPHYCAMETNGRAGDGLHTLLTDIAGTMSVSHQERARFAH